MAIEKLRPFPIDPPAVPPTPLCQALVQVIGDHPRQWRLNQGQKEPFTCSRPSVVKIGENYYCRLHGGHVALDMFITGKLKEV